MLGFEAILPLFFIIGCGYLARRTVLDEAMLPSINLFVYYFAVPALLFRAASEMSLQGIFYWPGIGGFLLGLVLTLAALFIGNRLFRLGLAGENGVVAGINSTFANYAYMGIPLAFTVLGEQSGPVTVMIILLGNILIIGGAQIALEMCRHETIKWTSIFDILNKSLFRSPIFISSVLGLVYSATGGSLYSVLEKSIDLLADAAIPVALFCLGAGLTFKSMTNNGWLLPILITIKLVLHPLLTWFSLWLLGVEDLLWLSAAVLLSALPTGALAHVIALKYQVQEKETSQLIALSTLLSLLTVSLWVSVLVPQNVI